MADGNTEFRGLPEPHNLAAEMAVLGAVIENNDVFPTAAERLGADDFYAIANRRIWEAVADLVKRGRVATAVSLREFFERDGDLKEIGGSVYLVRLLDNAAFGPELADYADVVRHHAVRRRMCEAAEFLIAKAEKAGDFTQQQSPAALLAAAREIIEDVETTVSPDSWEDSRVVTVEAVKDALAGNVKSGVPTGIKRLDNATGGLFRGDLIIVAGRPGMGKSALADQVESNVAANTFEIDGLKSAGIAAKFSLEMSGSQLGFRNASRSIHQRAGREIAYQQLRRGAISDEEAQALLEGVRDLPMVYWDTARKIDVHHMRTQLRRLRKRHGRIDLVTCDYLQIMEIHRKSNQNLSEAIGIVTTELKAMAGEFDCPVVCLSQLNKDVDRREDKRPTLADLRDSGSIEADADTVLFCYRDHYYKSREPEPKEAAKRASWEAELADLEPKIDVIVAKQRMGPICTVPLYWSAQTSYIASERSQLFRFDDPDPYQQEIPL